LQNTLNNIAYGFGKIDFLFVELTGKYNRAYVDDVITVNRRVNYNITKLNLIPFVETISQQETHLVITAYGNIIVNYDNIAQWKPSEYNKKEQQQTLQLTAAASGVTEYYTKLILDELYWGTKDGDIKQMNWIRPRQFSEYSEMRKTRSDSNTDLGLFDYIKYALLLGGIFLGVYIIFNIYDKKTIKE